MTGLQGGEDPRYLKVVADCKHYAGYDLENWHGFDRSSYNANITAQDLVESYLPSFEVCVNDANVASIMCSYNVQRHDTPAHTSQYTTAQRDVQQREGQRVTHGCCDGVGDGGLTVRCAVVWWPMSGCEWSAVVCQPLLPPNHPA